jgi:myo-inositol-1(or 4)-monophosphatase
MNSALINFILQSISKSSRFLYRDYFELEMQQSSKIINKDFIQRSYSKCEEKLKEELPKYGEKLKFEIIPIEAKENFAHAIPFFSIVVIAYKDDSEIPDAAMIDFPILGESYFAEKGDGAWVVKHNSEMHNASRRLKVSKRTSDLLLLTNDDSKQIDGVEKRNFGSVAYSICQVAAGKADALYFEEAHSTLVKAARLFMREASGEIKSDKPLILSNSCCNIPL